MSEPLKRLLKNCLLVSILLGAANGVLFSGLYLFPGRGRERPGLSGLFERLEKTAQDYRFVIRGTARTDPAIIYCDIDDATLDRFREFPIPRTHYADLLKRIETAAMVGFDILLFEEGSLPRQGTPAVTRIIDRLSQAEPGALTEEATRGAIQTLRDNLQNPDDVLAEALSGHRRALLPRIFAENYLGLNASESENCRLETYARKIHNTFSRDPGLYELWFDRDRPFDVISFLRQAVAAGQPAQAEPIAAVFTPQDLDVLERDAARIIPRVRAVDIQFVQDHLEKVRGLIIPEEALQQAHAFVKAGFPCTWEEAYSLQAQFIQKDGPTCDVFQRMGEHFQASPTQVADARQAFQEDRKTYSWKILRRGLQALQGQTPTPPPLPAEESTWQFLFQPSEFYREHQDSLQQHGVKEPPFHEYRQVAFAAAAGELLLNAPRERLLSELRQYRELLDPRLFRLLDLYVRSGLLEEKATDLVDILVNAHGERLSHPAEATSLARPLRTASDLFWEPTKPLASFCLATPVPAFITVEKDFDGQVRSYPLVTRRDGQVYFAMGLVMACHYLNVPLHALRLSPGHFLDLPDAAFPDGTLRTIRIPIDPHGRMRINWAGRFSDDRLFRHYRFDGVVDPDADKDFREEFRNRLVLVGLTAAGTHDNAPNPFESLSPLVGTHANVINTILTQQFIHPDVGLSRVRNAAAILTMAVLVALAMAVLPRLWGSMVSLALAGLYLLTVELAFIYGGLSLPILNTVLAMAGAAGTVLLYRYLTEERLRKRIRSMFSTMVSPEVMKYMEEHPELFRLAGERKSATIFFSDVAGFTTISETLSPEDLARVLNEYLTPMSRILMAYQGYIDKYAGDGIMADFGVPVWDDPDKTSHAWKCCWAALDQQAELRHVREAFQRKYGIDIHVRMGINSGEVSAGTMGSEQKLQYTVMGDTVNQAARFEPANKDFHTRIIIGEPTFRLARAKIEVRFLALLMVKGKTEPVRAYELLAREGELTPEQRRLIDLFDAAWRLHAERRFEEAARQFEACLSIDPADGPSAVYLEVCRTYQKSPPPEEWRGEWIQTSK